MGIKMAEIQNTDSTNRDVERHPLSFIAGGNAHGTATVKDSLAVPHKIKHSLYHMIQQLRSLVFTQTEIKTYPHKKPAHRCLHLGSNHDALQYVNG